MDRLNFTTKQDYTGYTIELQLYRTSTDMVTAPGEVVSQYLIAVPISDALNELFSQGCKSSEKLQYTLIASLNSTYKTIGTGFLDCVTE